MASRGNVSEQEKMISLMREILQDDYVELEVESYVLREEVARETCHISCKMRNGHEEGMVVEGEGVGVIDALFHGLRDRMASQYPSLSSIRFSQFDIHGIIAGHEQQGPDLKSEAQATVGIVNSEGKEFVFQSKARSVSQAGVKATMAAAEYFVNSERTFVRLYEILRHYRDEGRTDLVEKYTDLMAQVVRNTSYSEVVERIREELKGR